VPEPVLPAPRWPLVAFLAFSAANIVSDAVGSYWATTATKPFIVATLILWVLLSYAGRPPRLLLGGLVLALLGDVLLSIPGTAAFLAGMAAFLGMQLCYIAGFVRLGAARALRERPAAVAGWAVLWLALNLLLGPMLGALRLPIAVYSVALFSMAALAVATGSRRIGAGGVLFLVSDLLIGVGAAGLDLPLRGPIVMITYCAAQLLIVTGWRLHEGEPEASPAARSAV